MKGSKGLKVLEDALRQEGIRITRQRRAILCVLDETNDHPDAPELHRRAQALDPSVSLATIYRTLNVLEARGVVNRHIFKGDAARFETTRAPHHDHLIDLDNGEIIEFNSPEIEKIQKDVADRAGYRIIYHRLELYCQKKNAKSK